MNIVFLGSGCFACDLLQALSDTGLAFSAVIAGPDRPAGRGRKPKSPPLKTACGELSLPVLQPGTPREAGFEEALRALDPQVVLVADYGYLIPRNALVIPPRGFVNLHPSLLPRRRGAAPIQRAIMEGEEETGASLILLDEGLDTGPLLCQKPLDISESDDAGTLSAKLAALSARMVEEYLPLYLEGKIAPRAQDESLATYAPPIAKSELAIDWSRDSRRVRDLVRALSPRPGAFTRFRGRRIKILRVREVAGEGSEGAGMIQAVERDRLVVGTGRGTLAIELIQPEGRKVMQAGEFVRGYRPRAGEKLGDAP